MLTKIYDLAYEVEGDRIYLEQDCGSGEVHRLELHPIHLRLIAGEIGLLGKGDADAWARVEVLSRRLLVLQDRIDHMATYLAINSGSENTDSIYEITYMEATSAIAAEFCADLSVNSPFANGQKADSAAPELREAEARQGLEDEKQMELPIPKEAQ